MCIKTKQKQERKEYSRQMHEKKILLCILIHILKISTQSSCSTPAAPRGVRGAAGGPVSRSLVHRDTERLEVLSHNGSVGVLRALWTVRFRAETRSRAGGPVSVGGPQR